MTTYENDEGGHQEFKEEEDKGLHVLLETECWRFISEKAHFAIHNTSGKEKEITFRLKEIPEDSLLPEDLRTKNEIFTSIFSEVDAASIS